MKRRVGRRRLTAVPFKAHGRCHVTGKARFPTELTAKIEAAKMNTNGNVLRRSYLCKHCSMFHLTSLDVGDHE